MASYCDGRFSQDLFRLIAWRAKSFHRGTIAHIMLRWNAVFLHFLGFFLSFCILDYVLMLFLAFVDFPSYLGCLGHFTTNNNTKNDVEIPVISALVIGSCNNPKFYL
ncbi:hypothetical protein QL285_052782 [Trifolium repens]|nr:hypothetical protein QL285_052782 [Trifolium repens]